MYTSIFLPVSRVLLAIGLNLSVPFTVCTGAPQAVKFKQEPVLERADWHAREHCSR